MPVRETDAATVCDECESSTQIHLRCEQIIAVIEHTDALQVAIWIVARWQTPEAIHLRETDTATVRIAGVQLRRIAATLTVDDAIECWHLLISEADDTSERPPHRA